MTTILQFPILYYRLIKRLQPFLEAFLPALGYERVIRDSWRSSRSNSNLDSHLLVPLRKTKYLLERPADLNGDLVFSSPLQLSRNLRVLMDFQGTTGVWIFIHFDLFPWGILAMCFHVNLP